MVYFRIRKKRERPVAGTVWGALPMDCQLTGLKESVASTVPPSDEAIVTEAPSREMVAVGPPPTGGVVRRRAQSTAASNNFQPFAFAATAVLSWKKKKTRRSGMVKSLKPFSPLS